MIVNKADWVIHAPFYSLISKEEAPFFPLSITHWSLPLTLQTSIYWPKCTLPNQEEACLVETWKLGCVWFGHYIFLFFFYIWLFWNFKKIFCLRQKKKVETEKNVFFNRDRLNKLYKSYELSRTKYLFVIF